MDVVGQGWRSDRARKFWQKNKFAPRRDRSSGGQSIDVRNTKALVFQGGSRVAKRRYVRLRKTRRGSAWAARNTWAVVGTHVNVVSVGIALLGIRFFAAAAFGKRSAEALKVFESGHVYLRGSGAGRCAWGGYTHG